MLVPVLLMLFTVLVLFDHAPDPGPRPEPPQANERQEVAGWSGALETPLGERLTARLTSLHSEPTRQSFDTRALRGRLDLGDGEPWLLTLRYAESSYATSSRTTGGAPGEPEVGTGFAEEHHETAPGLSVTELSIADADGVALVPIEASTPGPGEVADPLRTLLAPTTGEIFPGQTVHVFLWGRAPRDGAELRGIPSPVADGVEETIALHVKTVRSTDGSLAMLERGAATPLVEPLAPAGGEER
jgi:hypothetical protein